MISFSPLTKLMVAAALVSSSTAGIAQSAPQAGVCQGTNCVLPLQAPAAPAPVEATPAPVDAAPVVETTEGKGLGLLPLLIGAALAAIALYFILDDEDEEEDPISA